MARMSGWISYLARFTHLLSVLENVYLLGAIVSSSYKRHIHMINRFGTECKFKCLSFKRSFESQKV